MSSRTLPALAGRVNFRFRYACQFFFTDVVGVTISANCRVTLETTDERTAVNGNVRAKRANAKLIGDK